MLASMISTDITKWIAWGRVVVREIHGWNASGADVYIQLFQIPPKTGGGSTAGTEIATGTVPAYKSILAQNANGFFYDFGSPAGQEFSELVIGLSSTEVNYTAVGTGLDLTIDFDSTFACDGSETVAGDLTTGQNSLQVWAEASSPKRLLRVDGKDNQNVDQLVMLVYAVDSVGANSLVNSFFLMKKNTTTTAYFGDAQYPLGFMPFQQDGGGTQAFQSGATYAAHRGCTLNITSEDGGGHWIVGTVYGGTSPNVRAIYK